MDVCPSGVFISEELIQKDLNRRKPGTSKFSTKRKEDDSVKILSGVFEGRSTGAPISLMIFNSDQHSGDYASLKDIYRPGHADYTFDAKYGIRDYRGGGRSSGRETAARVAAGAIARQVLAAVGVSFDAYTISIGSVEINRDNFSLEERFKNPLVMPDANAALLASGLMEKSISENDSLGGIVECVISGLKAGIGEPVFEKLDASIAQAVFSIGAVKGVEFGSGFGAAKSSGFYNNDSFYFDQTVKKRTNNSGGVLGGISDGDSIVFRAAFKPTPSINKIQSTINASNENIKYETGGRHDPVIVPRAVVVVETMAAITVLDYMLQNMCSKIENFKTFYNSSNSK